MQDKLTLGSWLVHLEQLQPDRIELGLTRIKKAAVAAGLHDPGFRILTVAGTNGKGSTVAYSASILKHSGFSVGVYTSPHFIDFNERIVVDDQRVSEADLCEAFTHIEQSRGDVSLTYFEFTTLAAIYCFKKHSVDIAVLEVGLGGRLDAANAWDCDVACITSIGIDHTDWLGDDREFIGREKAGVARAGRALVCGEHDPPQSIADYAREIDAQLLQTNREFKVTSKSADSWIYSGPYGAVQLPEPAIEASWANDNAAVAICACGQLLGRMPSQDSLVAAMREVSVDGRMQRLEYKSTSVLLDVAHNREAAALLAQHLSTQASAIPVIAVFSCMKDKDAVAIVRELSAVVDQWFVGQIDYPRAYEASKLAALLNSEAAASTEVFASVIHAFEAAVAQLPGNGLVVVFGSFHVVGPVLDFLKFDE